ncbi:MAG: hypothetical protein FH756_07300 [Firmicutes bacterium]|nr:hypothetical protein [Bacillota bacterium]
MITLNSRQKALFIFLMCLVDFGHSWWGVQRGYIIEWNVLVAVLLDRPFILFWAKNGVTLALLLVLLYLDKYNSNIVRRGLNIIILAYAIVMFLHINCLVKYLSIGFPL